MKSKTVEKIKLLTVDELLGVPQGEPVQEIPTGKIHAFTNHPFRVVEDDSMMDLIESIKENGVLTPVIVRPKEDGNYEMISGHRRLFAATSAGLETIPVYVKELTDDQATIAMVDSNLQRERILPSEKAFAYKMRYEAMRRTAGRPEKNLSQIGTNYRADVELAKTVGESRNQVHRYLRLTELIPELLDLVDIERIAISTAVDISFLRKEVQQWIYEYLKENGVLKDYQVAALREAYKDDEYYTQNQMITVFNENMPGKIPSHRISFTGKQLHRYFPAYYTADEMQGVIESLLEKWKEEQGDL